MTRSLVTLINIQYVRCNTQPHTATKHHTLQHTTTHYTASSHLRTSSTCTATHYNTLQQNTTPCNALRHTTQPCHTHQHPVCALHHTTTHCNRMLHPKTHSDTLHSLVPLTNIQYARSLFLTHTRTHMRATKLCSAHARTRVRTHAGTASLLCTFSHEFVFSDEYSLMSS